MLPKLGKVSDFYDSTGSRYFNVVSNTDRGDSLSVYDKIAIPTNKDDIFFKGPIRIVYFVFSPFPWNIKNFNQLIGLLDSLLYMIIVFLAWRNRKYIWEDHALRAILLILSSYIFVFGLSVGNFGTAIRHRSKFVFLLLLLIASKIPQISFKSKIHKNYKKKERK